MTQSFARFPPGSACSLAPLLTALLLSACGFAPAAPDEDLPAAIPAAWRQCESPAQSAAATGCLRASIRVDDATALIHLYEDPDLGALWQRIEQDNYTLAQSRMQIAAAAARAGIDTAALFPQLTAGIQSLRTGGEDSAEVTSHQALANVSWEIDLWGKLAADRRASQRSLDATVADFEATELALAAQTAKRWFDLITARQAVQLADANRNAVEEIARIVGANYRRGIATLLDLRVAQSSVAQAISDAAAAAQALVSARQALAQLTGNRSGEATTEPAVTAQLPAQLPALPARLPAEIVRQRPDIVAIERRYHAAAESWQTARLARLPAFTLSGDIGQSSDEFGDVFADGTYSWNVAAQLLAPLFDGGARKSAEQQAQAQRIEALYRYGEAVFNAVLEINSRIEQLALWQRRLSAAQNLQAATRSAEALALRDYRSGLADLSVLLNARRDAIAADRSLLSTQTQALTNHIDLLLALGGVSSVSSSETDNP
jgi:outer membrane protein, multidrug efflux system